jgi:hypothetical protein
VGIYRRGAVLRANPGYELVVFDQLPAQEQAVLSADVDGDDELYGALRPRGSSLLDPLAVSPDTALLFLTLREAAPLPRYVVERLGEDVGDVIGRLVLDGVLEVRNQDRFVSGASAAHMLRPAEARCGQGRIADLSIAALRYGQELRGLPVPVLAQRLYAFGRRPVSAGLSARFPDSEAVAIALHVGAIEDGWVEISGDGEPWRRWHARSVVGDEVRRSADYKLYVSPAVGEIGQVFQVVAGSLSAGDGVTALKVGRDLAGLCRPDKLIVYFERLADLQEAAARLIGRLEGCAAHGVPFTAAVTADGLLSWGADPPAGPVRTSWRMWVAERLAEYLTDISEPGDETPQPWRYALERLRLRGIDTDTWIPASAMWPRALADG